MSISPGIYAYLPGSPPPKPATPLSAVVFRSLLALGSVAATGLALKKYIWPDVKLAWEAYNSTGDQAASPATISEQGVENAGVTPAQETKASDSKFAKRAPYGRPPSQPGSEVGKRSVYGDVSGLDKVNALAAETKDELFSKGVAEMKHELSSLSDQLKQQSVDFNRALDTIQDTLEALKNSSAGGQQTGSSNSNNGSNGSRTGGGPSQLDDTKQSINQGDGGLKQPLTPAQRLAKGQAAFQTAYATMQSNHTAKEVKQAVTTMILYITNIFKNEHQERFRRIVRSNNLFKTRVASVEGAQTFLEACGFFVNKNHLEWIKPDDNDLELLQWSVPLLQSGLKFLEDTANVAVEVAQPQTQPQSQPQTQPQSQPQTQPQSQPQQVTPWTPTQAQKGSGKGGHDRTVGYPAVSPISSMNNTSVNGHLAADISNTVSSPFSPVTQRPQTQSGMSWVQESDTEEREDTRPNAAAQSVLSQNTTTPATVQVVDDSDEDPTNGLDDLLANVGGDDDSFN